VKCLLLLSCPKIAYDTTVRLFHVTLDFPVTLPGLFGQVKVRQGLQ